MPINDNNEEKQNMNNKKYLIIILLVAIGAYALGYYQKPNSVSSQTSNQVSIDTKIKCHDEAVAYRDDKNKNPDTRLFGIKPYELIGSGYNIKQNNCFGFYVNSFIQLSGNLVQDEEVIDLLPSINGYPVYGTWYGDMANAKPADGFFLNNGQKDTSYGDWGVYVNNLLNNY